MALPAPPVGVIMGSRSDRPNLGHASGARFAAALLAPDRPEVARRLAACRAEQTRGALAVPDPRMVPVGPPS